MKSYFEHSKLINWYSFYSKHRKYDYGWNWKNSVYEYATFSYSFPQNWIESPVNRTSSLNLIENRFQTNKGITRNYRQINWLTTNNKCCFWSQGGLQYIFPSSVLVQRKTPVQNFPIYQYSCVYMMNDKSKKQLLQLIGDNILKSQKTTNWKITHIIWEILNFDFLPKNYTKPLLTQE